MKGKIIKHTDFWLGRRIYNIEYNSKCGCGMLQILDIDMAEFMDDIFSDWMKESFKKEYCESGYVKDMFKAVITSEEKKEQDRDEGEIK